MTGFRFITFISYIIILLTLIGLISMIFNLHRFAFFGEFLILLGLILATVIMIPGLNNNSRWSWILLTLFFVFVFVDMIFINAIRTEKNPFFFQSMVIVVVGFFISLFSIEKEKIEPPEEPVKKTFKPGKFIASKSGAKFHAPKSEWGKKIKKKNAIWFNSKAEAVKAGYKPGDGV